MSTIQRYNFFAYPNDSGTRRMIQPDQSQPAIHARTERDAKGQWVRYEDVKHLIPKPVAPESEKYMPAGFEAVRCVPQLYSPIVFWKAHGVGHEAKPSMVPDHNGSWMKVEDHAHVSNENAALVRQVQEISRLLKVATGERALFMEEAQKQRIEIAHLRADALNQEQAAEIERLNTFNRNLSAQLDARVSGVELTYVDGVKQTFKPAAP